MSKIENLKKMAIPMLGALFAGCAMPQAVPETQGYAVEIAPNRYALYSQQTKQTITHIATDGQPTIIDGHLVFEGKQMQAIWPRSTNST